MDKRNHHLLHGYAAMLDRVLVVLGVVVQVIRIHKEIVLSRKDEHAAQVLSGQEGFMGPFDFEYVLRRIGQILTGLIA